MGVKLLMPKLLQSFLRTGSKISMTLRAGVLNGPLSWDRQLDCSKKSARLYTFVKESSTPEFDKTIGRKMESLQERDAALEKLWKQFADVPMNHETEKIEAPFLHLPMSNDDYLVYFDIGTPREDIWHWFDERHSKGVVYLLYGRPFYEKDPDDVFPLKEFLKQEVPFRLSEIFHIPDDQLAPHIIEACIDDLCNNSDSIFNYDSVDAHIRGTLAAFGINPDDYEES